jgi:MazG family protein
MSKERLFEAISTLSDLVLKLRGPDGCPWDARQTDSTIKMFLLEEAYEVLDAIEKGSPDDVCQELGDLLFQILFLACLAQERGEFDLTEVIERITGKMINRHPHVFGTVKVNGPSDVSRNWAKIKKEEKGSAWSATSTLQDVPSDLPALLRSHRLSERASKVGFDRKGSGEVWKNVKEKFEKLSKAQNAEDKDEIGKETGNLLLSIVDFARHWGLNAENLLREANREFIKRFMEMEEELRTTGMELSEATTKEMRLAWEKIRAGNGR